MVVSSWLPIRMEAPPAAGAGVPSAAVAAAGAGAAAGAAEAGAGVLQHPSVKFNPSAPDANKTCLLLLPQARVLLLIMGSLRELLARRRLSMEPELFQGIVPSLIAAVVMTSDACEACMAQRTPPREQRWQREREQVQQLVQS